MDMGASALEGREDAGWNAAAPESFRDKEANSRVYPEYNNLC